MIRVNLLPQHLAQQQLFERRLRFWIIVWIIAGITAAIPWIAYASAVSRETRFEETKNTMTTQLNKLKQLSEESDKQISTLESSLGRAEALRTKRPWNSLLHFIAQAMPQGMWLSSIESQVSAEAPRTIQTTVRKRGRSHRNQEKVLPPVKMQGASALVIKGFAQNHTQLYNFISQVKEDDVFQDVDLIFSGTEEFNNLSVIRFEIKCDW